MKQNWTLTEILDWVWSLEADKSCDSKPIDELKKEIE